MTTLEAELTKTVNNIKHEYAIKHSIVNSSVYYNIIALEWKKYCILSSICNIPGYLVSVDSKGFIMKNELLHPDYVENTGIRSNFQGW